jgi:hypothetical protein
MEIEFILTPSLLSKFREALGQGSIKDRILRQISYHQHDLAVEMAFHGFPPKTLQFIWYVTVKRSAAFNNLNPRSLGKVSRLNDYTSQEFNTPCEKANSHRLHSLRTKGLLMQRVSFQSNPGACHGWVGLSKILSSQKGSAEEFSQIKYSNSNSNRFLGGVDFENRELGRSPSDERLGFLRSSAKSRRCCSHTIQMKSVWIQESYQRVKSPTYYGK